MPVKFKQVLYQIIDPQHPNQKNQIPSGNIIKFE